LEVMQLGIELGGWLGPITPEIMQDQDLQITEAMRENLRAVIERVNQPHQSAIPPAPDRDAPDREPVRPEAQSAPIGQPESTEPRRDDRELLLEQLRQRREARERENQNGQP
jgi:hypothetical protein